jgi:hypothetical protein
MLSGSLTLPSFAAAAGRWQRRYRRHGGRLRGSDSRRTQQRYTNCRKLGDADDPGSRDLAAFNLDMVFVFDGGPNQGCTISTFASDFDLSIAFSGAGGATAFNNTKIPTTTSEIVRP